MIKIYKNCRYCKHEILKALIIDKDNNGRYAARCPYCLTKRNGEWANSIEEALNSWNTYKPKEKPANFVLDLLKISYPVSPAPHIN